jgi:hypothetical protein
MESITWNHFAALKGEGRSMSARSSYLDRKIGQNKMLNLLYTFMLPLKDDDGVDDGKK